LPLAFDRDLANTARAAATACQENCQTGDVAALEISRWFVGRFLNTRRFVARRRRREAQRGLDECGVGM